MKDQTNLTPFIAALDEDAKRLTGADYGIEKDETLSEYYHDIREIEQRKKEERRIANTELLNDICVRKKIHLDRIHSAHFRLTVSDKRMDAFPCSGKLHPLGGIYKYQIVKDWEKFICNFFGL